MRSRSSPGDDEDDGIDKRRDLGCEESAAHGALLRAPEAMVASDAHASVARNWVPTVEQFQRMAADADLSASAAHPLRCRNPTNPTHSDVSRQRRTIGSQEANKSNERHMSAAPERRESSA